MRIMNTCGNPGWRCLAFIVLPILMTASCSDDSTKPPVDPPAGYPSATTIDQLLQNLERAYEDMNQEEYARLIDDGFTFVFDSLDVGPDMPWRFLTWGKGADTLCAGRLFGGEPNVDGKVVDRIYLQFTGEDPEPSTENPDWQMVDLIHVDLQIVATDQQTGDQWLLVTPGHYQQRLHLVQRESEGGPTVWKIVMWEDISPAPGAACRATEPENWGAIKALWADAGDQETDYPSATTISQLLQNFELSHEETNYDEYALLLDEEFVFVFDPRDVGSEPGQWPDTTWSRTEDLVSAANMLGGEPDHDGLVVESVVLEFDAGQQETSQLHEEWQFTELSAVDLSLLTRDHSSGDEWILQTPGNYEAHLHLVQKEPDEGMQVWRIIRWEDRAPAIASSEAKVGHSSWGQLKISFFRSP